MLVTLHTLAQTYNLLPSEALARATTFDLFILDNYSRFMKYQEDLSRTKSEGIAPPPKKLTQEEMIAMIERVRNRPIESQERK